MSDSKSPVSETKSPNGDDCNFVNVIDGDGHFA